MFRRTLFFSLAALILATPATAQRFGYQDAPQSRSDRNHSRQNDRSNDPPRNTYDDRRGGSDHGKGDHRDNDRNSGDRNSGDRNSGDRNSGDRNGGDRNSSGRTGSDRPWQQQPDPRSSPPEQRHERSSPPDRQRNQQDQGQGQGQRPSERPPERPREVQLTDILRNLRGQYGGQHLDAQRSGENYVIPWLSRDGRRMTVVVDAATGRVISVR